MNKQQSDALKAYIAAKCEDIVDTQLGRGDLHTTLALNDAEDALDVAFFGVGCYACGEPVSAEEGITVTPISGYGKTKYYCSAECAA